MPQGDYLGWGENLECHHLGRRGCTGDRGGVGHECSSVGVATSGACRPSLQRVGAEGKQGACRAWLGNTEAIVGSSQGSRGGCSLHGTALMIFTLASWLRFLGQRKRLGGGCLEMGILLRAKIKGLTKQRQHKKDRTK